MNLVELIKKMPPRQRQMLRENVRKTLLKEDVIKAVDKISSASVGDTAEVNGVEFVKTDAGWKTTFEATTDQIVSLVISDAADFVKKELDKTKPNDDYEIIKAVLKPDVAIPVGNKLTFRRLESGKFVDPTFLSDEQMQSVMSGTDDLRQRAGDAALTTGSYMIGSAEIKVEAGSVTVTVPNDNIAAFRDIFGEDVTPVVAKQIAANSDEIKIPSRLASEDSLFKRLDKFNFLKLGSYNVFKLSDSKYELKIDFSASSVKKFNVIMTELINSGKATKKP